MNHITVSDSTFSVHGLLDDLRPIAGCHRVQKRRWPNEHQGGSNIKYQRSLEKKKPRYLEGMRGDGHEQLDRSLQDFFRVDGYESKEANAFVSTILVFVSVIRSVSSSSILRIG